MPNWIEGTFRVRGSLKNVKQFIDEGLGTVRGKMPPVKIEYDSLSEELPKAIYPILGRIPPLLSEAKVGDEC